MKKLLSVMMIGVIGAALMGCEASARVGDEDRDGSYRRTTTVDRDGDVRRTETRTETEIRRD